MRFLLSLFLLVLPTSCLFAQGTCADPIVIDQIPYTNKNTFCGKTNNFSSPLACDLARNNGPDVVYRFTPTETGTYYFVASDTLPLTSPIGSHVGLVLRSDCNFNNPTGCIGSSFKTSTTAKQTILNATLTQGLTYYLKLEYFSLIAASSCSDYYLQVFSKPVNDSICRATPIPTGRDCLYPINCMTYGYNVGATLEATEPTDACAESDPLNQNFNTVWYYFDAYQADMTFSFLLSNDKFHGAGPVHSLDSLKISLYQPSGLCSDPMIPLETFCHTQEEYTFTGLKPCSRYYLRIDGNMDAVGDFEFYMRDAQEASGTSCERPKYIFPDRQLNTGKIDEVDIIADNISISSFLDCQNNSVSGRFSYTKLITNSTQLIVRTLPSANGNYSLNYFLFNGKCETGLSIADCSGDIAVGQSITFTVDRGKDYYILARAGSDFPGGIPIEHHFETVPSGPARTLKNYNSCTTPLALKTDSLYEEISTGHGSYPSGDGSNSIPGNPNSLIWLKWDCPTGFTDPLIYGNFLNIDDRRIDVQSNSKFYYFVREATDACSGTGILVLNDSLERSHDHFIRWAPTAGKTYFIGVMTNVGSNHPGREMFTFDFAITKKGAIPPTGAINMKVVSKTNPTCPGKNDGRIEVIAIPHNYPCVVESFTYTWNTTPAVIGPILNNIAAGTYKVYISNGIRTDSLTFELAEPDISVSIDSIVNVLPGCGGGSATVRVYAQPVNFNNKVAYINNTIQGEKFSFQGVLFYWEFKNVKSGTNILSIHPAGASCGFDSVLSVEYKIPKVEQTVTNATCFNKADGKVVLRIKDGVPPYNFTINFIPVKTDTFLVYNNLEAGSHFLQVFDQSGCEVYRNKFNITRPSKLIDQVSGIFPSHCVESDGSFVITTTGSLPPYQYSIDDGIPVEGTNGSFTFKYVSPGKHIVKVTDTHFCLDSFVVDMPDTTILKARNPVSIPSICEGSTGEEFRTVSGGFKPYIWQLNNDPLQTSTRDSIHLKNLSIGTHRLKITDSVGCEYFETINVGKKSTITGIHASSTPVNCNQKEGSVSIDSLKGGVAPYLYKLVPLYDDFVSPDSFAHLGPGTYRIYVSYAQDCIDSSNAVTIVPKEIPYVQFQHFPEGKLVLIDGKGDMEFKIDSSSQNITRYEWNFGDGGHWTDTLPDTKHTYTYPGTYSISVKVTNTDGCVNSFSEKIYSEKQSILKIPDIFSPNGDGLNDVWDIATTNVTNIHIQVFDRWGGLVFETVHLEIKWDGKNLNGQELTPGTYVAKISALDNELMPIREVRLVTLKK